MECAAPARKQEVLVVILHTNRRLLTPEIPARLMDMGLTRIVISVDAFSADTDVSGPLARGDAS